jgi:hypothetical protein
MSNKLLFINSNHSSYNLVFTIVVGRMDGWMDGWIDGMKLSPGP